MKLIRAIIFIFVYLQIIIFLCGTGLIMFSLFFVFLYPISPKEDRDIGLLIPGNLFIMTENFGKYVKGETSFFEIVRDDTGDDITRKLIWLLIILIILINIYLANLFIF